MYMVWENKKLRFTLIRGRNQLLKAANEAIFYALQFARANFKELPDKQFKEIFSKIINTRWYPPQADRIKASFDSG